jgi:ferredoxin
MFVIDTLIHRLKRGCETMTYPSSPPPALPDRHGGALKLDASKCADGCNECVPVCPTQAIARPADKLWHSTWVVASSAPRASKPVDLTLSSKPVTTVWLSVVAKTLCWANRAKNKFASPSRSTRNYASSLAVR